MQREKAKKERLGGKKSAFCPLSYFSAKGHRDSIHKCCDFHIFLLIFGPHPLCTAAERAWGVAVLLSKLESHIVLKWSVSGGWIGKWEMGR